MSIVKSFAVGNGDMFYIDHNSDNFSIVDCFLPDDRKDEILEEINDARKKKGVTRFISTHPDQDHIGGLALLDNELKLLNFYVVKNGVTKHDETDDFRHYKQLRGDSRKAFFIERDCRRRWMNESDEERKTSGISIRWPVTSNREFRAALQAAEDGWSPNNISAVIRYAVEDSASVMWMGDLETDFMESVSDAFTPDATDILFAPHHGRKSGRVPEEWLDTIAPRIIVVGEAPSAELTYYEGYDKITQNSAGDIVFECLEGLIRVYVSEAAYAVDFLEQEDVGNRYGYYVGTLFL